jgi:hypothetical protein
MRWRPCAIPVRFLASSLSGSRTDPIHEAIVAMPILNQDARCQAPPPDTAMTTALTGSSHSV